jgi:hypothetical protein
MKVKMEFAGLKKQRDCPIYGQSLCSQAIFLRIQGIPFDENER